MRSALIYFNMALSEDRDKNNLSGTAINLNNIGNVYSKLMEHEKAISFFYKSVEINEKLGKKIELTVNFNNIANAYVSLD